MPPNPPAHSAISDVVLAVIIRDGQVLLSRRRAEDPFGGYWELPGGKCQLRESILDCLAREVREELGVGIHPGHAFTPIIHAYAEKTVRLLAFACSINTEAGAPTDPQPLAADSIQWAPAAELPMYRFPEANAPLITEIVEYLATR
jgi:mutator protein MutT